MLKCIHSSVGLLSCSKSLSLSSNRLGLSSSSSSLSLSSQGLKASGCIFGWNDRSELISSRCNIVRNSSTLSKIGFGKWRYKDHGLSKRARTAVSKEGYEKPYPIVSPDPEIFKIQQEIFGYHEKVNYKTGRKILKAQPKGFAMTMWYPPTEEQIKSKCLKFLKNKRRVLRMENKEEGGKEDEIAEVEELIPYFRYTYKQEKRRSKIKILKRRGKGPPKKGAGRRAMKKK